MSTDPKEITVTNIDDNDTGWISRLVGAWIIAGAIYGGSTQIADALDGHTDAVEEQTKVLQEIHAPSAE